MRPSRILALGCALLVAACSRESLDPIAAAPTGTAARPVVARVVISSVPGAVLTGQKLQLDAAVLDDHRQSLTDRSVVWRTSDGNVATLIPFLSTSASVLVLAHAPGTVTVTAESENVSTSVTIRVLAGGTGSTALVLESASVVEFQYPDAPGRWFYAPLARVRDRNGAGAIVVGFRFTVPGIGTAQCAGVRAVSSGGALDLFREVYGDYELSVDRDAARATSREADVTVLVDDGAGGIALIGATVPVVQGALPTTYTGLRITERWSC